MAEDGTLIPDADIPAEWRSSAFLHTHVNSQYNKEAILTTVLRLLVTSRYPLLTALGLLGMKGFLKDAGTIPLPAQYTHKGAQNAIFKPV